jgi:hypothetical protein
VVSLGGISGWYLGSSIFLMLLLYLSYASLISPSSSTPSLSHISLSLSLLYFSSFLHFSHVLFSQSVPEEVEERESARGQYRGGSRSRRSISPFSLILLSPSPCLLHPKTQSLYSPFRRTFLWYLSKSAGACLFSALSSIFLFFLYFSPSLGRAPGVLSSMLCSLRVCSAHLAPYAVYFFLLYFFLSPAHKHVSFSLFFSWAHAWLSGCSSLLTSCMRCAPGVLCGVCLFFSFVFLSFSLPRE